MENLEEKIDLAAKEIIDSFKGTTNKTLTRENRNLKSRIEKFKEKHKQRLREKKTQYEQKLNQQKSEYESRIEQITKANQETIEKIENQYKQKIYTIQTTGNILKIKNDAYEEGKNSLKTELNEYITKCRELEGKIAKYHSQKVKKTIITLAYVLLSAKIAATAIFAGYYFAQQNKTKEYITYPASNQQR